MGMRFRALSLIFLISGILLVSGCVQQDTGTGGTGDTGDTGGDTIGPALSTCAELGGDLCDVGDECDGEWLDASDTFSCCSQTCVPAGAPADTLDIDPFDPEPENEGLGDVV